MARRPLNDFISSFVKPARTNRFEVEFPGSVGEILKYRVENTELPGRAVTSIDQSYYGPVQKMGGTAVYTDLSMTLLLSDYYVESRYFYEWSDKVVGNHRVRSKSTGFGPASAAHFNVGYFDEYKKDVIIRVFDESDVPRKEVTLREAYPSLVSPINLGWGNSDIARLTVTIAYRYWTEGPVEFIVDKPRYPENRGLDITQPEKATIPPVRPDPVIEPQAREQRYDVNTLNSDDELVVSP